MLSIVRAPRALTFNLIRPSIRPLNTSHLKLQEVSSQVENATPKLSNNRSMDRCHEPFYLNNRDEALHYYDNEFSEPQPYIKVSETSNSLHTKMPYYNPVNNDPVEMWQNYYDTTPAQHEKLISDLNFNHMFYESRQRPFPQHKLFGNKCEKLNALREKEKGPWGEISSEETKQLYFAHFHKHIWTYHVNNDRWKYLFFWVCFTMQAILCTFFMICFDGNGYEAPLYTNDPVWRNEMAKYYLQNIHGPVTGIASHYDYRTKQWIASRCWLNGWPKRFKEIFLFQIQPAKDSGQIGTF